MIALLLPGIEAAINKYLSLDPAAIKRLSSIQGKVISLFISDWHIQFYLFPNERGIELSEDFDGDADTKISGTLNGFMQLYCRNASTASLFANEISVEGNTQVGETIRDILANVDIDWEEHLANCFGDIVAHKVAAGFRRTNDVFTRSKETMRQNIKEYLLYESRQLPEKTEIEKFVADVTRLQNDVERAQARLERLIAQRDQSEC